jgi:8-oxo-dGTP diphosphatase
LQTIRTYEVTAAIIEKDQRILITRRAAHKHLAGLWELPGGKIEEGETPEECLKRELEEELGLIIKVNEFFMENTHDYDEVVVVLKAYLCELISGEITLKDHDQFAWVERKEFNNYEFASADIPIVNALNNCIF